MNGQNERHHKPLMLIGSIIIVAGLASLVLITPEPGQASPVRLTSESPPIIMNLSEQGSHGPALGDNRDVNLSINMNCGGSGCPDGGFTCYAYDWTVIINNNGPDPLINAVFEYTPQIGDEFRATINGNGVYTFAEIAPGEQVTINMGITFTDAWRDDNPHEFFFMVVLTDHDSQLDPNTDTIAVGYAAISQGYATTFNCAQQDYTPTVTLTQRPSLTNTPTVTLTPTVTNTPTPTSTPTNTLTNTPSNTPTNRPTNTPSNTPTFRPTNTPSNTPTNTPTHTPTAPKQVPTTESSPTSPYQVPPAEQPGECVDWLLFHSMRDEQFELYRLMGVEGADGASLTNLTEDEEALEAQPSRSWNQEWVAYHTNTNGNWDIYLTDQFGEQTEQLTDSIADEINPVFSYDNRTIAFQSNENGNWDLYLLDRISGETQQVTDMSGNEVNPYFSPSPDWLTYQSNQSGNWDVYLLYIPTGYHYRVTNTEVNEINPSWSPNGQNLAFLRQSGEDWELVVSGMYGNRQQVISTDVPRNPSWSPDGWRIAYQAMVKGNLDIYYYDLNSFRDYRVTTHEGPDTQPSWNCDGRKIAFTSPREGNNQNIFSVLLGSEGVTQMTNHEADDRWALWFITKEFGSKAVAEVKYNENKLPKRSP